MYGNMSSPFAARNQRATLYAKVGLETDVQAASPHRLVAMLFDGVFDAMAQATQAIQAGNVELKGRSLSRAVRILDEGLRAALDLSAGQLATDLRELYGYVCTRLTQANLHGDLAARRRETHWEAPLEVLGFQTLLPPLSILRPIARAN